MQEVLLVGIKSVESYAENDQNLFVKTGEGLCRKFSAPDPVLYHFLGLGLVFFSGEIFEALEKQK